jgi:hypothetical protein
MRQTILAAMAAIGICAAAALAQEKNSATPGPALATGQPAPGMPTPGPEVAKLEYFAGGWSSTGHIKPSALGGEGDTEGRDACRWLPGKFFMGCIMESRSPMGRIQTEGIMGYDTEKKIYTWTSFDSTGRQETATGKLESGTWTWSGQTKMGDKTMKTRYVMTDTTPQSYSFRWETSPDGKDWKSLMEGKVTKMSGRPTPARAATPTAVPTN